MKTKAITVIVTAILAFAYWSCSGTKSNPSDYSDVLIIATGANGEDVPDNTLSAFANSIGIGSDMLSFKVYFTHDDVPIIAANPYFDIVGSKNNRAHLSELGYHAIRQAHPLKLSHGFSVFKNTIPYPSISDLVRLDSIYYQRYPKSIGNKVVYQIGIMANSKGVHSYREHLMDVHIFVKNLLSQLPAERLVIYSDDPILLRHIHRHYPEMPLGLETQHVHEDHHWKTVGFKPDIYRIKLKNIDDGKLESLNKSGFRVFIEEISTPAEMRKAASYGADGVCTKFPSDAVIIFGDEVNNPFTPGK
ncbi:hypothetical protein FUAX_40470 (plasmid) [Fulvitalea axinellae]|uniref:GP-PDE domain-containing protein n=1 Tax=Fulvitalea axinellae TaxID=1182444 RepID=A0AAU9CQF0_9BACT|nr:hypothetical protein FUAX_40470 [Fulvitalea axinellae]